MGNSALLIAPTPKAFYVLSKGGMTIQKELGRSVISRDNYLQLSESKKIDRCRDFKSLDTRPCDRKTLHKS
jgi:hypothetical protein